MYRGEKRKTLHAKRWHHVVHIPKMHRMDLVVSFNSYPFLAKKYDTKIIENSMVDQPPPMTSP